MRGRTWLLSLWLTACGGGNGTETPDAAPDPTGHCEYAAQPANANATGTTEGGALQAGAAEAPLDLPVGSALGAFTARAGFLGNAGKVDIRKWPWSGSFNPSIGIETTPMVKAVALTAGSETVIIVKADLGVGYDGLTHDLGARLGLPGKILLATSHSHSGPGHFTASSGLQVGFSRFRRAAYDHVLDRLEEVARAALADRAPAKIGFAVDTNFDPANEVTRDRRPENDALAGGSRKDAFLAVIRVDRADGTPLAALPVFGVHGTVLDADNPLMSTDAPGAIERGLEEQFDRPVVVLHLQGAAGDVSPAGSGGVDCGGLEFCANYARAESTGRAAAPLLHAAWQRAGGATMSDQIGLEMLTRSIELGPRAETFTVRGGALTYAPFDGKRACDGEVYDDAGKIVSPIDEFNAPYGAALCGTIDTNAIFPDGQMPGTECPGDLSTCAELPLRAYQSCVQVDTAATMLSQILQLFFEKPPVCGSTRTTVSALRLGQFLILTLPGEPVTLLVDRLRTLVDAVPDDMTIVVGFAQGHMGYLLTAEDWLQAGYEPSINFWGPLEGELIAEQAARLAEPALSIAREDGAAGAASLWVTPAASDDDDVPPPDPAPLAGQVPATVPAEVYARGKVALASAQPAAQVQRFASARFVWIGEDPLSGTPVVTLQRESPAGSGTFVDVKRRSGRPVRDGDLLRTWTPVPLRRAAGEHATHYWVAEWQAVTWWGSAGTGVGDALGDRAGVPLGRYRFHVEGTGYAIDSQPFEVVAGALGVAAARDGNTIGLTLTYPGTGGWRLLDPTASSNRPVPLRGGSVHVVLRDVGGGTRGEADLFVLAGGKVTVDAGANAAQIATVEVTDGFGNRGSATL